LHQYEQLRAALRSARDFVDALEVLVDELEAEARSRAASSPNEDGACENDHDFQVITIGAV
jgi:hypothetical protein